MERPEIKIGQPYASTPIQSPGEDFQDPAVRNDQLAVVREHAA
jgi:hypothetical protein